MKIGYAILFWVLCSVIMTSGCGGKKKTNWHPNFDINSKEPFGLYVLSKELTNFKGVRDVKFWRKSLSHHFNIDYYYASDSILYDTTCFIAIHPNMLFNIHVYEEIVEYVAMGNTAILAAIDLPDILLDSLGIKMSKKLPAFTQDAKASKIKLCHNPRAGDAEHCVETNIGITGSYFYDFDPKNYTILTTVAESGDSIRASTIRLPLGDGHLILIAEPMIFTNYFILNDSLRPFTETAVAFIPENATVFWKVGQNLGESQDTSVLRFIMAHRPLKIAFYLLVMGMVLFIFFTAKRRQRVVPIQEKNTNTTIEFVRTIGNLYYQSQDYGFIVQNKIKFALNKVRNDLHISTDTLDEVFVEKLAYKTQKDITKVAALVHLMEHYRLNSTKCDEADIIKISKAIAEVLD